MKKNLNLLLFNFFILKIFKKSDTVLNMTYTNWKKIFKYKKIKFKTLLISVKLIQMLYLLRKCVINICKKIFPNMNKFLIGLKDLLGGVKFITQR